MGSDFLMNSKLKEWLEGPRSEVGAEAFNEASQALDGYFTPLTDVATGFSGGTFEKFAFDMNTGPDRSKFTSDDVVALQLLSVNLKHSAVAELLITKHDEFSKLLDDIDVNLKFWELPKEEVERSDGGVLLDAYRTLSSIKSIGETSATKLLARKRPNLFPIIDSKVREATGTVGKRFWLPLYEWLEHRDGVNKLETLREAATAESNYLSAEVSILRVFDVLAWLAGSGKWRSAVQISSDKE